ncbi:MAG: alpha-L-fucosidase [Spirochaetales bacterium]|nr:alpha-L-fucosidase [Spirochaetales bacterium]
MKKIILFVFLISSFLSCINEYGEIVNEQVDDILYSDLPPEWSNGENRYSATWESLDTRECPEWFEDAKLGLFVHWGIYSVPAWSPVGVYAEWYQHWLVYKSTWGLGIDYGNAVGEYHTRTYGADFSYYDFVNNFTAENFDPNEWAELFEASGAKYTAITSKHHDGFSLWDDETANKTWGFPWNAVTAGPKRDLLADLKSAMSGTSVKFGLYYSMYEWFNPLWKKTNKKQYVTEHMLPQFKNLFVKYQPEFIWSDGDWHLPSSKWYSKEILKWMFNNSPNRDTLVVNDRWGTDANKKYGDYYTSEYGTGLKDSSKAWEECRGMGFSFGYNQNEKLEDYSTGPNLILLLCDVVSRGGNLLLNIGPKADGTIPEIMQTRLREMGSWLSAYGEAIYGTRAWKTTHQWSDGTVPEFNSGTMLTRSYDVVKLTVNPDPGMAVKELYFTQKDEYIYVIVTKGSSFDFTIKDVDFADNISVYSLSAGKDVTYQRDGNFLKVKAIPVDKFIGYPAVYRIKGIK